MNKLINQISPFKYNIVDYLHNIIIIYVFEIILTELAILASYYFLFVEQIYDFEI